MARTMALIMAGGEGTRMKSAKPKALHPVCGLPIIRHVLRAVQGAGVEETTVIISEKTQAIEQELGSDIHYALQRPENGWGTARAVMAAKEAMGPGYIFVLACDMPLIKSETLLRLKEAVAGGAAAALMSAIVENPTGYGRILRDEQGVVGIVEHRDASEEQRAIREINASVFCFDGEALIKALPLVKNENAQSEYYLTDVISILRAQGRRVEGIVAPAQEGMGINDRVQLAQADAAMRRSINEGHMRAGVTLIDPEHTYIGSDVIIGEDTLIHAGCTLSGNTVIGRDCLLLPGCRIEDSRVGDGVKLESSVLLQAQVGGRTTVGPFAYLRPGTVVGEGCRVGDFVELKNANIGDKTKISHLTYVGDADLGKDINLGCGVVFSNYDGKRKYRTSVGDHAFIGGNVNLVSPVNVGESAYIAAGSTITEDVPAGALAVARERQTIKEGWVERRRQEGKL